MSTYNKFHCFLKDAFEGKHNFQSDTLKLYLSATLPLASHQVFSDIPEISAMNGYQEGGLTLTIASSNQVNGNYKLIVNDITLLATGPVGPFRYPIVYNATSQTKPLICWFDYGSNISLNTGNTFFFDFSQVDGLFGAV
jgi:hypothetical protein